MSKVIFGCGDVGRRIVKELIARKCEAAQISGYVNSLESVQLAAELGLNCAQLDLDKPELDLCACQQAQLYYTVAPQKEGITDQRSRRVISNFNDKHIKPQKVVLISTTGVYGDCDGDWVDESSLTRPQTERGQRRLDSERQWLAWGVQTGVAVVVLRVPAIYAFSRLPRARLEKRTPVVKAEECGFTNRIHADDLARVCVLAMQNAKAGEVFNVTDGKPGKITEYLQAAAEVLGFAPLPEISMEQAQTELSQGMLSYLSESRKISNQKMLNQLGVELRYPDFRQGLNA